METWQAATYQPETVKVWAADIVARGNEVKQLGSRKNSSPRPALTGVSNGNLPTAGRTAQKRKRTISSESMTDAEHRKGKRSSTYVKLHINDPGKTSNL